MQALNVELKTTLSDWDTPRNPVWGLHVPNKLPLGGYRMLGGSLRALRAGMPGRTADFLASVLDQGLVWQITIQPSRIEGFATVVRLEPDLEVCLEPPFTKYLAPIVAHAELPDWAGPVCRTRLRVHKQNTAVGDPVHRNYPFTRAEVRLSHRFGVAMHKLAAA